MCSLKYVLLFTLLLLNSSSVWSSSSEVDQIHRRLLKVLDFLENNYEDVNADGLFGVRIAEGRNIFDKSCKQKNLRVIPSTSHQRMWDVLSKNVFFK